MRIQGEIEAEIEEVSEERRRAQRAGTRGVSAELAERLDALYVELREARASEKYGTREQISRSARIERELEKVTVPEPAPA